MKRIFLCLILLCIAVVLVPSLPAQANLDRVTTIDVKDMTPYDIYAGLSRLSGYGLIIDPSIQKPVSMYLDKVTVRTALNAISEGLGCRWSIEGNILRIKPDESAKQGSAGSSDKTIARSVDFGEVLKRQTPANFRFDNASLGSVLDALGRAFDCNIGIDEAYKARKVTADLSNLAFISALNALHNQSGMTAAFNISVSFRGSDKKILLTLSPTPGKQTSNRESKK